MDEDGVKKMIVLTAEAVGFGRRVLDLSFAISSHVRIVVTTHSLLCVGYRCIL